MTSQALSSTLRVCIRGLSVQHSCLSTFIIHLVAHTSRNITPERNITRNKRELQSSTKEREACIGSTPIHDHKKQQRHRKQKKQGAKIFQQRAKDTMAVLTLSPHVDGGRQAILKRLRQTQRDRQYRVLTFNSIEFDEAIVKAVVDLLNCDFRKWERINFINCSGPVDAILANALALDTVHALELVDAGNDASKPLVKALGRGLLNNTSISILRLRVGFFDTPASLTRGIAMNRNLHELDVSGSWFRGNSVPALADTLRKNETLRVVCLKFCGLTDCEIAQLVEAMSSNTSLQGLEIGQYSCGPLTLAAVGKLLENNNITWLRIRHQSLRQDQTPDLSELANKLASNTSLKSLDLSLTKLDPAGMACLGLALQTNSSLQYLILNHCGISAHGIRSFSVFLPHMRGLKTLKLTGNPIEDNASDGLIEGVRSNHELEDIYCSNLSKEIRYFLDLNRSGRRLLFASRNTISSALWPLVLERANKKIMLRVANNGRDDDRRGSGERLANVLYSFLRERILLER
jgi:hypothetical protein